MFTSAINYVDTQKWMEELELEIFSHPAWHGDLPGVECEDILRGLSPNSYLLREGERRFHYYLSFVLGNSLTFKHQPFLITLGDFQVVWGYRNGIHHWASNLESLLPLVMHCDLQDCHPILKRSYGE